MAINPFNTASDLRGDLNKETLDVAQSAYALPATVPLTPEPLTGDNNSLRTLMGETAPKTFLAAGGLVKKVVERQRQRVLPKMSAQPQYMADGGPVCKAEGGPVTEPRPTTMAEDTVPARLHPDEYVIPAEVVRKKGVDFFDRLVKNAQGERKGIVPTMTGGTVYAASGGDTLKAIEEATGIARKSNYVPLSAQAAAGQTTPIQEYENFARSQTASAKGPSAAQAQIEKSVGVGSKAGVTPLSAQAAAGQTTPIQEYEKFAQSASKTPKAPSAVQSQIEKSVGVGSKAGVTPLTARGADAEIVSSARTVKSGLEGTVGRMFSKLPEYEAARALVAAPKYQQGLNDAAKTIQNLFPGGESSFAGKALPGQTTAVDRKDFTLQNAGSATPSTGAAPSALSVASPTASSNVKTSNLGALAAPEQTRAGVTTPAYSTTTLPDGTQRLVLTEPTGEKVTPEQIAATDAADAKRLAGILNFDNDRVANFVKGQGGFDPIEQYKQKLAADAEYQRQRDVTKEIQFRNYGQVFPEERGYGQVDNSPVTKQMELDAASKIAATPGNPEFGTDKYGRIYQTKGAGADKFNQDNAKQQDGDQAAINAAKAAYFNLKPPSPDEGEEAMLSYQQRREKLENFFRMWDTDTAKLIDKQKIAGML